MADKKTRGNLPKRGPGRPPGSPNKLTRTVKEAIIAAFEGAGGVEYLKRVAAEDPRTFCTLLGRIVPHEVAAGEGVAKTLADILIAARARTDRASNIGG